MAAAKTGNHGIEIPPTRRMYWEDDGCFETNAVVVAMHEDSIAFDQTCLYPGGGGQPHDIGSVTIENKGTFEIASVHADTAEIVWHRISSPLSEIIGCSAKLMVNRERRHALACYHTALHVLNTIALRDYGGWITGVQIAETYSRIDFKWDEFSAALLAGLETKVNRVLSENHALKSYFIPEEEFKKRNDLRRTLEAKPPVYNGQVRVVAIGSFDAQACGGTHVMTTAEVGRFSIFRTENKGKINKRLYVRLELPTGRRIKHGARQS